MKTYINRVSDSFRSSITLEEANYLIARRHRVTSKNPSCYGSYFAFVSSHRDDEYSFAFVSGKGVLNEDLSILTDALGNKQRFFVTGTELKNRDHFPEYYYFNLFPVFLNDLELKDEKLCSLRDKYLYSAAKFYITDVLHRYDSKISDFTKGIKTLRATSRSLNKELKKLDKVSSIKYKFDKED